MSRKDEIILSEKHGLNPSMSVCFFCGEVKGIALMGHIGDKRKGEDLEAPKQCITDYEPCEQCKENMNLGITLIEVTTTQPVDNRPPLTAKGDTQVYPTGRWSVLTEEGAKKVFKQDYEAGQKLFVDPELFNMLMPNEKEVK